jgi:hypothetical protein
LEQQDQENALCFQNADERIFIILKYLGLAHGHYKKDKFDINL